MQKNKKILIICLIICLAVGIGVGIYFLLQSKQSDDEPPPLPDNTIEKATVNGAISALQVFEGSSSDWWMSVCMSEEGSVYYESITYQLLTEEGCIFYQIKDFYGDDSIEYDESIEIIFYEQRLFTKKIIAGEQDYLVIDAAYSDWEQAVSEYQISFNKILLSYEDIEDVNISTEEDLISFYVEGENMQKLLPNITDIAGIASVSLAISDSEFSSLSIEIAPTKDVAPDYKIDITSYCDIDFAIPEWVLNW